MDMGYTATISSMNTTTTMASGMTMMTNFITSLGTSNLWFSGWTPTTVGGTFGSAVGLFFLAVFSRLLSTISTGLSKYWDQNVSDMRKQQIVEAKDLGYVAAPLEEGKQVPPFIFSHDVPRGIIFMLEAFVGYLLMLAVMSYNAWFFIAILLGMMAGEVGFGRWKGTKVALHH